MKPVLLRIIQTAELGEPTFITESRWAELNFSGHPDGNHKQGASEKVDDQFLTIHTLERSDRSAAEYRMHELFGHKMHC
jgi:hypothetical protein